MSMLGAVLVAILIGAILPLQGLVNARLGTHVGGPVVAAFVSFLVGTVMLGLYLLATRTPLALQGSLKLPAWVWAGGVFGAIYVACFTLLIPRIGAAGMICLAVPDRSQFHDRRFAIDRSLEEHDRADERQPRGDCDRWIVEPLRARSFLQKGSVRQRSSSAVSGSAGFTTSSVNRAPPLDATQRTGPVP